MAFAVVALCIAPSLVSISGSYADIFQFDENDKFTVLQLADIQESSTLYSRVLALIRNLISRYSPDLVVFTGDNQTGGSLYYKTIIDKIVAPLNNSHSKFAVTFGNHDDDGSGGSKTSQYSYYMSMGGNNFVDHDVAALDGVGSGVIPIYPYGQTSGTPAWQVYLMDSGSNPSSGSYDACYTSQIDYYIQRSNTYPEVPFLWFQHIIVPDIYSECMSTSGSGTSYDGYYIVPARYSTARSSSPAISTTYKEAPCPPSTSLYQSTAHRSSSTYGSKTLYEAWSTYGNLKGAYFGHDHLNEFTCTTDDGIDLGYGESTTLYKTAGIISYNDDNPSVSIYELDEDGSYQNQYYAESDIVVTFNKNDSLAEGYMTKQSFTKNEAKALSLNTFSKPNYDFAGWNTAANGSGTSYANGAYFSGSADTTLYAKWTPKFYNITFNANGGTGDTGPTSMQATTALSAPAVSHTGYTLSGWSPAVPLTVPFADTTYTAQWTANTYTVKYDGNGSDGGSTSDSSHIYDIAKNLTSNGFTRTGYSFTGWTTSVGGALAYTNTQSVKNLTAVNTGIVTFYAVWSINSYNITFNANGGTGGTGTTSMVYNSTLTAPVVSRTGYNFNGWSPEVPTTVPAAHTTYTAQWSARVHSIIFDANGGTGGTGGTMAYGAELTPPTVTKTGHSFTGWSPPVPATVPDADATYTAQWSPSSYTIIFDVNGGTGGTSASMVFDTALSPPSVSRPGFTFIGWSPEVPARVPAANSTYTAQWSQNTNNVVCNANGGNGGISTTMTVGIPIISPSVTRSGYLFTGWTPALPGFVIDGFNTYSAKWVVNSYQITFDANGGTGDTSSLMTFGDVLTPPVVTRVGYLFTGWEPAVPSTVVPGNQTYMAKWMSID